MSYRADQLQDDDARSGRAADRLARRLTLAGFGLMFVAGLTMWAHFGPAMFMDLATAIAMCF